MSTVFRLSSVPNDRKRRVVASWWSDGTTMPGYTGDYSRFPDRIMKQKNNVIRFTAEHDDATLLPVNNRHFRMPTTHTEQAFGGFGGLSPQAHIWYGLNECEWRKRKLDDDKRDAARYFRDRLCRYMKDPDVFVLEMMETDEGDGDRRRGTSHPILRDPNFRSTVLEADGGKCALTCEDTDRAIEAAHLVPASQGKDDRPCNGIMLRADLHRLFDARLFRFDPSGRVVITEKSGLSENYLDLLKLKGNCRGGPLKG